MTELGIHAKRTLSFVIVYLVTWHAGVVAHRLNVPRVLLPVFNDFAVNFTLEVTDDGCYQWSTSQIELIQLIPINGSIERSCSSAVVIQPITRELTRNTAIVLAEDINSGQLLRCYVILDAISSLSLITTTRELYIEEAPEAFEVRAYDEQGNEFTTLAGVEFAWSISNADKHAQYDRKTSIDILKFITYQESEYETPSTVAALDAVGKEGHIILLEGIRTGTAKVSVQLPHPEYQHVPAIHVELIIIANLIIIPSDVSMMAFDTLRFKIMQTHQGRLEEIDLASSQYYLEAENGHILEIDNDRASAYALSLGRTKVFLHDKNIREEHPVALPSATVNVNKVVHISLTVLPNRNRGLILGHVHEIIVELYDDKDQKFHIGKGVEVSMKTDERYIDTILKAPNGTYMVGIPTVCGTTTVEATLHGIMDKHGKKIPIVPPLKTKTELSIHTPVTIQPKTLAIPWNYKNNSGYDIALKANGGDGSYIWNNQHPSIITVSQNGGIRILSPGWGQVTVAMTRNPYNKDTAKVYILRPSKLKIIEYNLEAAIGEFIHLHVALYGELINGSESRDIPFDNCINIDFELYVPDGKFVRHYSEDVQPVGIACAVITVSSLDEGTSELTVKYNTDEGSLSDNVTVSAYEALVAIHPYSKETLLAVGSSRNVIFKGGPRPWSTKAQSYSRKIQTTNSDIVNVTEIKQLSKEQFHLAVFQVLCMSLGEAIVTYTVSNVPVLPNCKKTFAFESIKVICGKPLYISLLPQFEDSKKCPIVQNREKIMIHGEKKLKLLVSVKDEDGRQFDNITSLNIGWSFKPSGSATVEALTGLMEETVTDMDVILPRNHYQNIITKNNSTTVIVSATIIGYQRTILGRLKITPEWPPFAVETEQGSLETPLIETSIEIAIVNDTIVTPNKLTILNDPSRKYLLQVSQGSGYYEVILSSNDIATISYIESKKVISVVPKSCGVLNVALVDLCLPSKPAEVTIEVQQLAMIEVDVVNKIEKGKCVIAALKLYDTNLHLIEWPLLNALDFKIEIDNEFIDVKQLPPSEHGSPPYEKLLYTIYGIDEGESRLIFTHKGIDRDIQSESINIQVFRPLRVKQKNVTMLIGTIYQLQTSGGPSDADIEFSTKHDEILSIRHGGVFEGKSVGQTQVVVKAVGLNKNGKKVTYSEDYADLHVVYLEGVKIVTPMNRVKIGATFPLWAFGIPEYLTPLVIGSMQVPLIFMWSTSDSNLLSLHNMYEGTGINIRFQNEVSLRAKAIGSGLATVYLNVTMPCNMLVGLKSDVTYTTFIKVEIFEELQLINPELGTAAPVVLMSPNSVLKLQTNRDKYGSVVYKIITPDNTSEDTRDASASNKYITIDKNGVIKSKDAFGRTLVSVTNIEMYNLKQSLVVIIEVKPVHYILLSLGSNLRVRSGEELNTLPKGMELNYILDCYDNIGTKFHAAETSFEIATNRMDLTTFTKRSGNSLAVKFIENGELVLKVFNEMHPNAIFDYVRMMIGEILFPVKTTLTVGDIVCFSMPLLSPDGDPGYWQSSSPDILTVDPIMGIARAQNIGRAIVKHSLATSMQGEIEVDIQPISKISIVPLRGKNITGTETFRVPLVLKSKDEHIKENNVLARGLGGCRTYSSFSLGSFPYSCNIQFTSTVSFIGIKDLFLVRPRFDIVTGFYYCDIVPTGALSIAASTLDTRIQINVQCRDVEVNSLEVPYVPPVYIGTKEVAFITSHSHAVLTATLDIYGLQLVLEHLTIDVPNGITVSGKQYLSKHMVQYRLRLIHNQDDIQGQKVIVGNELTNQNISLFVRVARYDQLTTLSGIHWVDYMYFHRYTVGTVAVIALTLYYVWKNKMGNIDLNIRNKNVFADKCPPPLKKLSMPCTVNTKDVTNLSTPRSTNVSLRPFPAFQPVYGDPRGFYTPTRRNRTFNST